MKKYKGSFTIEAAYILPLILFCICIAIEMSVSLHGEVRMLVETQRENQPLDIVEYMYRREYVRELLGEVYED